MVCGGRKCDASDLEFSAELSDSVALNVLFIGRYG
jgi:hypothetical protein